MTSYIDTINSDKFLTPDMGEYYDQDLVQELFDKVDKNNSKKPAFYIETPFTLETGYYKNRNAFVIKADPVIPKNDTSTNKDGQLNVALNRVDGDTMLFKIDTVDDGGMPFEVDGVNFNSMSHYFKTYMNRADFRNGVFSVRTVGVNACEIPHYGITVLSEEDYNKNSKKMNLKEIKAIENSTEGGIMYEKLNKNNDSTVYDFIYLKDKRTYYEVKNKSTTHPYPLSSEGIAATNKMSSKNDKKYLYLTIVNSDSQTEDDLNGDRNMGIEAKDILIELLTKAQDIRLVLDQQQLKMKPGYSGPYNQLLGYTRDQELWDILSNFAKMSLGDYTLYPRYNTFGQDAYRRFLGCIYVKIQLPNTDTAVWVNTAKYIINELGTKYMKLAMHINPAEQYRGGNVSDAFKVWTYDINMNKYADAFYDLSKDDMDDRRRIQKALIGNNFDTFKDYTVMLGDCLFTVPPTSIRIVNQSSSDRVPLLRGKGSMIKTKPDNERIIEMTLYFNNDYGINGIPIEETLPNGDKIKYHMNGLRSLIAMFKTTPFLPIENDYINNVLDVESVALLGLGIETMPMYPKCLAVTLTLQSFNYRIYLNDLPIPEPGAEGSYKKNMFSSCINYQVMRYYYQKAILAGELLKNTDPTSTKYIENTIGSSTKLVPMKFEDQTIKFFTLDRAWLEKQLNVKTLSETRPINSTQEIKKEMEQWIKDMTTDCMAAVAYFNKPEFRNLSLRIVGGDIHQSDQDMIKETARKMLKSSGIKYISDVIITPKVKDGLSVELLLDLNLISLNELSKLVSTISSELDISEMQTILKGGKINLELTMTKEGNKYSNIRVDTSTPGYSFIKYMYEQMKDINIDSEDWEDFDGDIDKIGTSTSGNILRDIKDALDTESFLSAKFIEYPIEDIVVQNFRINMGNVMSNIGLKTYEGKAPQYSGGQDIVVEFSFYTKNEATVGALNMMQSKAVDDLISYRKVLQCWPVRIHSEFTKFCGINEVAIESISIDTVPNMPGLFVVNVRALSMDRTMRNRERLNRIDSINNAGANNASGSASYVRKTYFDLHKTLGEAEVYPDLELPTIEELEDKGFMYIRYALSKGKRKYPDPDFYFVYAFTYGSQMLKKVLSDYFDSEGSGKTKLDKFKTEFADDTTGQIYEMAIDTKETKNVASYTAKYAANEQKYIQKAKEQMMKSINRLEPEVAEKVLYKQKTMDDLLNDMVNIDRDLFGGTIPTVNVSDNIKCTFRENYGTYSNFDEVNTKIESISQEIIKLIEEELSKPIRNKGTRHIRASSPSNYQAALRSNAKKLFNGSFSNSSGDVWRAIFNILGVRSGGINVDTMANMVVAAGMTMSGDVPYDASNKDRSYAKSHTKINQYDYVPYAIVYDSNGGRQRKARTLDDAIQFGGSFGAFQIKKYGPDFINTFYEDKKVFVEGDRFLDPYYGDIKNSSNIMNSLKDKEKEYITGIIEYPVFAVESFSRLMLIWMKDILKRGILLNYYDIIRKDMHNKIQDLIKKVSEEIDKTAAEKKDTDSSDRDYIVNAAYVDSKINMLRQHLVLLNKLSNVTRHYEEMLVNGKVFTSIMLALAEGEDPIYGIINSKNVDRFYGVIDMARQPLSSYGEFDNMRKGIIFVKNCVGSGAIKSADKIAAQADTTYDRLVKENAEKLWIDACNDPNKWIMHSFYDMVVNNKRGRMARAFPTYYMLLVDEGRDIGYWKLHDNFYNTSAIAEIEVTKSRKIAADTARIVMTNMFRTFTTEDEDLKTNYTHNLMDVWNSIFSPSAYFEEEEIKRLDANPINRGGIRPGARIHLRMGYSGDANDLPILFNGTVAEVSNGEVVELIAQGDGHEISNPEVFSGTTAKDMADLSNEDAVFKWIQNFFNDGSTPKQLIQNVLTTKSGILQKFINSVTNGRFFNDNMFGITHFGSIDYKAIHANGEVMQNIYEGEGGMPWTVNTASGTTASFHYQKAAPVFTVELKDKSVYDLLNICAATSLDFISAVGNFNIRSSIFHGRPHYYFAYDYTKDNGGNIVEKRKPYQQYHLISSYCDIIANNIKASAQDIRTCAVVTYKGPNLINISKEKKLQSPMWVDFNIYPEYQKTTLVNTNMQFKGKALGALLVNSLYDKHSKDGGAKIAWRMGAKALKDSIKDMYQGEVMIIGDPVIKPYDKVYMSDVWESMNGMFEVEAVVHRMSPETGFTSSIFADCVSAVDDRWGATMGTVSANMFTQILSAQAINFAMHKWFYTSTKPILNTIAKTMTKGIDKGTTLINKIASTVSDKEMLISYSKSEKWSGTITKIMGFGQSDMSFWSFYDDFMKNSSGLAKVSKEVTNITDLSNLYKNAIKMNKSMGSDSSALIKSIDDILTTKKISEAEKKALTKFKDLVISGQGDEIGKSMELITKSFNNTNKLILQKLNGLADQTDEVLGLIVTLEKATVNNIDEVAAAISKAGKFISLADLGYTDEVLSAAQALSKAGVKVADSLSDNRALIQLAARGGKTGSGIITGGLTIIAEAAIQMIITSNIYNYIESVMGSLRVLTIYPLRKNGAVMVAGIDGHKGLVVGSPSYEKDGLADTFIKWVFKDRGTFMNGVLGLFVFSENMKNIASKYYTNSKSAVIDKNPENMIDNLLAEMSMGQTNAESAFKNMILGTRLKNINDSNAQYTFKKLVISSLEDSKIEKELIPITKENTILSEYFKAEVGKEPLLKTVHENVDMDGNNDIPMVANTSAYGKVYYYVYEISSTEVDIPFMRPDAFQILNRLLFKLNERIEKSKYGESETTTLYLKSGTLINTKKYEWASTGQVFRVESSNKKIDIGDILKEIQDELIDMYLDKESIKYGILQYSKMSNGVYQVFVTPRDEKSTLER